MGPENIITVIEALPLIFIYFVPGYIFIKIMSYRFSKNLDNINHLLLKSIVASYIIILIVKMIFILFKQNFNLDNILIKVLTILLALISGVLVPKIITGELFNKALKKMGFNKSMNPNIFDDIIDVENGTWFVVYIPSEKKIYQGIIQRYEDRDYLEDYFLILSNYKLYDYKGNEIEDNTFVPTKWVMVNTKDISRIEILYSEDSKMIKDSILEISIEEAVKMS